MPSIFWFSVLPVLILVPVSLAKLGKGLLHVIASAHALDAALGVHNPLLSGVERVAVAANLNT